MTGQANFLQSLGWAVLNSLWQLALLWVIYQVIIGLLKGVKSSYKSSLASSLLIGGFGWFVYTFITAFTNGAEKTILSSAIVSVDSNEQAAAWLQQALPIASILYLVLLILPLLHFVRNYRYVQVIRKYGLTKMHVEWRMFVRKVATQMDIRKKVQIWVSEFVSSPVTIGFLKPVILVPLAAINHLTPQQLEAVLLHELSHIKRLDYLINLIINFIHTVLYFNPFAKAFVKIVEREREKSCDEMVLQFQYDSYEYANALFILEKATIENKPMVVAVTGQKRDLLDRVELIMGVKRKPVLSFNRLAGLIAGLVCILMLNFLFLSGKQGERASAISFAQQNIASTAFQDDNEPVESTVTAIVEQPSTVVNHIKQEVVIPSVKTTPSFADYVSTIISPALIHASLERVNVPELKKYQEDQVERTLESSKKVLGSVQWKVVEKSIAEVFNQKEKEELKALYEKEMEKFDWKKWETDLKLAYNNIDWDKINSQLSVAVNKVRLDSIQTVYNKAISKLNLAHRELSQNHMQGIPDTDITIDDIDRKKVDMLKALEELKTVRKKKIVHL